MDGDTGRAPVHLWIVGVVAILWNAFGCVDYLMTQTQNEAWLAQFTPEQRAYFDSFPTWLHGFWALGVWGALLGSLLLLMRSRHAVTAFAVSLVGLAVSTFYTRTQTTMPEGLDTPQMVGIQIVIWVAAIFFLVYAMKMRARGVLR
ncbi:MAG TPA: hypothetical protein VF603_05225 [Allosphingosinicella sp.]